jgi:hypothetical protein
MNARSFYSNERKNYGSESISSIVPEKTFIPETDRADVKHEY